MTQAQRIKADAKAKEEVAERMEAAVTETKRKRGQLPEGLTADAIDAERAAGRSWAQVAVNLGLRGPSAARSAYTALTGQHHNDAGGGVKVRRTRTVGGAPARRSLSPQWAGDEDEQEDIEEKLKERTILVRHKAARWMPTWDETIMVLRVVSFSYGKDGTQPLQVTVCEGVPSKDGMVKGGFRNLYVNEIMEVK